MYREEELENSSVMLTRGYQMDPRCDKVQSHKHPANICWSESCCPVQERRPGLLVLDNNGDDKENTGPKTQSNRRLEGAADPEGQRLELRYRDQHTDQGDETPAQATSIQEGQKNHLKAARHLRWVLQLIRGWSA